MKITLDKLQQIITEEVLKEELAAEIAAPAIAAMLQGTEATATSDIFGAVFDEMYGEGALEAEAERQAAGEEGEEEDFPTDYQSGGAYGDRPQVGFKESLERIIKEEFSKIMNEKKLTDAEYKKKKEIADTIERDDPDMPDDKRYAIATAAAKKSAE